MVHGGEGVLVAVSGGPDSVALLHLLAELAASLDVRLAVAHVAHGLRPEAEAEADFTQALADRLGLCCHIERVTVRREPPWEGLEAEARRARHAALEGRARAIGAARIATGHTADDQAETVLMRLLDGAGPRGLAAMAPVRGPFVRPLIATRRAEVLGYLAARGIRWCEDVSNRDLRFRRNRIRHEILPYLAQSGAPSLVEALCRTAALCRAVVDDLEQRARTELARLGTRSGSGLVFSIADVQALGEELAAEVLLEAARTQGESGPRRAAVHRAVRRLASGRPARRAFRIDRLVIERSGRWLRVGPPSLPPLRPRRWRVPGSLELAEVGVRLAARRFDRPADYAPPRGRDRVAFDADRLPECLLVRPGRRGERLAAFGSPVERRLKSLLIEEGVPRWERPRVPMLDADGALVWIVGVRRGHAAPIAPETRRILEVTVAPL